EQGGQQPDDQGCHGERGPARRVVRPGAAAAAVPELVGGEARRGAECHACRLSPCHGHVVAPRSSRTVVVKGVHSDRQAAGKCLRVPEADPLAVRYPGARGAGAYRDEPQKPCWSWKRTST